MTQHISRLASEEKMQFEQTGGTFPLLGNLCIAVLLEAMLTVATLPTYLLTWVQYRIFHEDR